MRSRALELSSTLSLQTLSFKQVLILIFNVMLPVLIDPFYFFIGHESSHLCRRSHHHRTRRNNRSWRHERTGCNKRLSTDGHIVEHDGPDPDQAAVLYAASVKHCGMADGHALPDDGCKSATGHVDHRVVLDIRAVTDADVIAVAAQNAVEPDARVLAQLNVANYLRAGRDKRIFWN